MLPVPFHDRSRGLARTHKAVDGRTGPGGPERVPSPQPGSAESSLLSSPVGQTAGGKECQQHSQARCKMRPNMLVDH